MSQYPTPQSALRWTQWIFLQLFKKGLAYQAEVPVNWCPALGTVLANEEVGGSTGVDSCMHGGAGQHRVTSCRHGGLGQQTSEGCVRRAQEQRMVEGCMAGGGGRAA